MEKKTFSYMLPIGLAPSKIEECKEELEAALNGICEFKVNGRMVTITVYKGQLKKEYQYQQPVAKKSKLEIPIGVSLEGQVMLDMSSDSHSFLLVGGNPGTGKSVFLNQCIDCLSQYPPEYLRLILIDLKMGCELGDWEKLPHTWLTAYDPTRPELKYVLTMLLAEIKKRMKRFKAAGVKKIADYNCIADEPLNYIMLVIDEYAELKNSGEGNDYEQILKSILQTGRAAGVRCIAATQRPTVDCISGTIKAVFTDRLAFAVSSALNSRVILDCDGAEKLPNDIPGRAIFLTGSRFQEVQVMNYSSPILCELPDTEHIDSMIQPMQ